MLDDQSVPISPVAGTTDLVKPSVHWAVVVAAGLTSRSDDADLGRLRDRATETTPTALATSTGLSIRPEPTGRPVRLIGANQHDLS